MHIGAPPEYIKSRAVLRGQCFQSILVYTTLFASLSRRALKEPPVLSARSMGVSAVMGRGERC